LGGRQYKLVAGRKEMAVAVLAALAVVREFYACSTSEALRLSLIVHANAIRANKALPEIER
jgi:hypothetical protein